MAEPSDNVWVGDLPIGMEQAELNLVFEAYGQIVESRMLPGRDPNAKPCAMVRFASVEMASWVVENLNANIPEGLEETVICRFANAPGNKPGKGKGKEFNGFAPYPSGGKGGKNGDSFGKAGGKAGKGGEGKPSSFAELYSSVKGAGIIGSGKVPEECMAYVKNLPPDTTDLDLYKLFSPFGAIAYTGVKAMLNQDGSCKGFGFCDFTDPDVAASAVMALNGHTLPDGSTINVSTKLPSNNKGKGKGKGYKGKGKLAFGEESLEGDEY
jgi:RNA recognition motif-containing protein